MCNTDDLRYTTDDLQLDTLTAAVLRAEEAHSLMLVEYPDHGPTFTRERAITSAVLSAKTQWALEVAALAAKAMDAGRQMNEDEWQYVAQRVRNHIVEYTEGAVRAILPDEARARDYDVT